jgi:uncharacterized protein (TIGR02284 family)
LAQENTIERLNDLVLVNKDAEAGFRTSAENIKNSELETLFSGYAAQHAKFGDELRAEIRRLDGKVSDEGDFGAAVHRGWIGLKTALTGHSAAGILSSCESAEQSAEVAYADASDANPTGQTHALLQKHSEQIRGFRVRLARLVGETKDGVDFQKNE